jgi:hypothetical protein
MDTQPSTLAQEARDMGLFLTLVREQLKGTVTQTDDGVVQVIHRMNAIRKLLATQNALLHAPPVPEAQAAWRGELAALGAEIAHHLSAALGYIQFQDVIRQRLEHAQQGLDDLTGHCTEIATLATDPAWDGQIQESVRQRLERQRASYVMNAQRDTHAQVMHPDAPTQPPGEAIELF